MPSLTESLGIFFTIASWIGFTAFAVCALFGGWIIVQVVIVTFRVAYARWRWKKYQLEISNGNLLFAHKLANHFIREANKTEATEPKNPHTPTHTNEQAQTKGSRSKSP